VIKIIKDSTAPKKFALMTAQVMENVIVQNVVNAIQDSLMLIVPRNYVKIIVIIMDIVMMVNVSVKMDILEPNVLLKLAQLLVIVKENATMEFAYAMKAFLVLIAPIDSV